MLEMSSKGTSANKETRIKTVGTHSPAALISQALGRERAGRPSQAGLLSWVGLRWHRGHTGSTQRNSQLLLFLRTGGPTSQGAGSLLPTPRFPFAPFQSYSWWSPRRSVTRAPGKHPTVRDDWLHSAKARTPSVGRRLSPAVPKGGREACLPPAVSRTLPLPARGAPLPEAGCGRSR